jgi:hypothetical protein
VRWDAQERKFAVTEEHKDSPEPIGLRAYWFPTLEAATLFANAQKQEVKVLTEYADIMV